MPIAEPCNLKEWSSPIGRLFTCSRPGRATYGTKKRPIPQDAIRSWINGLPAAPTLHLVSLLGWKKDGYSEFSYYPFRSEKEANAKPTICQWMDAHAGRSIVVHEFPTEDRLPIAAENLEAATQAVESLVAAGAVVVVMDSAGSQRTGAVCDALGSSFMRRLTPPCR